MAFFGLTQLGYQDTIREHVRDPDITPQYVFRSGMYRDPGWRTKLPPIENKPKDSNSSPGVSGPQVSHVEYTRMKTKHIRSAKQLKDIYRYPVITSAQIGMWRKDEPLHKNQPWTYVPRHVHINSEMTSFVDEMSLTNREFSLF